jgi:cyclopropane fatty-acyl-phospholipid synthase-like methyltransferase
VQKNKITTLTLSIEQSFLQNDLQDRITVILRDHRKYGPIQQSDKFVSIEMIKVVGKGLKHIFESGCTLGKKMAELPCFKFLRYSRRGIRDIAMTSSLY